MLKKLSLLRRAIFSAVIAACTLHTAVTAAEPGPGPDFSFVDLGGASHTLSQFRGRVVLLEFWASWCAPCRKGFPFLDGLQVKHKVDGLSVVAVTLETDEAAVREFVSEHPGSFLVGRDPSGRAGELYEVSAMPSAILLDREGRILVRFEGGTNAVHRQMAKAVEAALRGEGMATVAQAPSKPRPLKKLKAWERGYLADPIMNLDGDPLTRSMRQHVHASKEAAAGDGGISGGGCGCN